MLYETSFYINYEFLLNLIQEMISPTIITTRQRSSDVNIRVMCRIKNNRNWRYIHISFDWNLLWMSSEVFAVFSTVFWTASSVDLLTVASCQFHMSPNTQRKTHAWSDVRANVKILLSLPIVSTDLRVSCSFRGQPSTCIKACLFEPSLPLQLEELNLVLIRFISSRQLISGPEPDVESQRSFSVGNRDWEAGFASAAAFVTFARFSRTPRRPFSSSITFESSQGAPLRAAL